MAIAPIQAVAGIGNLVSLSKASSEVWLDRSELLLLIFGLLVGIGIIGEILAEHEAKIRFSKRRLAILDENENLRPALHVSVWKKHKRFFEILVLVGVCGEFVCDGGVWLFGKHLQTISDIEVAQSNKKAEDAGLLAARIGTTNGWLVATNLQLASELLVVAQKIQDTAKILDETNITQRLNDTKTLLNDASGVAASVQSLLANSNLNGLQIEPLKPFKARVRQLMDRISPKILFTLKSGTFPLRETFSGTLMVYFSVACSQFKYEELRALCREPEARELIEVTPLHGRIDVGIDGISFNGVEFSVSPDVLKN